jgi:hypothetical protein
MLKSTVLVVLAVVIPVRAWGYESIGNPQFADTVIPVRVWMWAVNDLFTVNGTSCSRARVDAGGKIELFGHYTTRGIGTFGSDKAW